MAAMHTCAAYFVTVGMIMAATGEQAQQAAGAPKRLATSDQISKWIKDLDADRFVVREVATQRLIEADAAAVPQVADSLQGGSLEVTTRGIHILRELSLSGDIDTEESARLALEKVAAGTTSSAARRAATALRNLDDIRQVRALEELQQLGANVRMQSTQIGLQIIQDISSIEIGENWRGEDRDLRRLKWLGDIQAISLSGERITDETLKQVSEMKGLISISIKRAKISDTGVSQLQRLKNLQTIEILYTPIGDGALASLQIHQFATMRLFGTNITREGARQLQIALANKIDYRQGAFLGVSGQPHPNGCMITFVHPASSASKAGLMLGDVIVKFEGKRVPDFDGLTTLIGENKPGDTVTMEVLREGESLTKQINLGEWE
jgi:hypothetical protein